MIPGVRSPLPGFDVLRRIETRNFPAFLVGGAVRDLLWGLPVRDVDIVTLAPPEVLRELFPEARNVGVSPRAVWLVPREGGLAEVSSCFPHSLEEDLERRDFTVNALALGRDGELVDRVGGMEDILRGRLRWNGDPRERLRQDPLRALRLVRFAATLPGVVLVPGALAPCAAVASALRGLPGERVGREMRKGFQGNAALFLELLDQGRMLDAVLPELEDLRGVVQGSSGEDVLDHTRRVLGVLSRNSRDLRDRGGALWHDVGKASCSFREGARVPFPGHEAWGARRAAERMTFWRWPRSDVAYVEALVRHHTLCAFPPSRKLLVRLARRRGVEWLESLLLLARAHGLEKGSPFPWWEAHRREVLALRCRRARSPEVLLSGREIMALAALSPGPRVGALRSRLEEAVDLGEVATRQEAEVWVVLRSAASEGDGGTRGAS